MCWNDICKNRLFDIKVLNTGNVVHRMQDLIPELRESNNLVEAGKIQEPEWF